MVRSGVSAERNWLSRNKLWRYWLRGRQDKAVRANQAIRATGGGLEARVAVHVKRQPAGVRRVRDGSTCVPSVRCELMVFSLFCSCNVESRDRLVGK